VQVAFGTDSGALPERIPGWAEHHELELMVRAGLSPMDAIVAATQKRAALIKASDRGTLEVGKRADLLVLAADPSVDVRNTRQLVSVWHGCSRRRGPPRRRAVGAPPGSSPGSRRVHARWCCFSTR
jgi:imidazolonepropionase-like amidohydrolase